MNNGVVVFLIERVAGQEYDPAWGEKIPFILGGLAGLVLVWLLISCWYWKRFSHSPRLRHLFFWTVGVLVSVVVFKLGVHHFYKNYWGDRWFFYAIPSPRIQGFTWFLLPLIIFSTFLYFRSKIETLKERQFLVVIWAVFVSLALSVAGIRGGVASIIDPLTRTFWEYTGALPFIQARGTIKFLHEFISLLPALPVHVQVHPPGYALALYFWQRLFQVGNLGLAVLLVMSAGLVPVISFYLTKAEVGVERAKRVAEVLVLLPSLVLFSATSMEGLFVGLVWLSFFLCYRGWKNSVPLSFAAGLVSAYSLFSNFLFALAGPAFFYIFCSLYSEITTIKFKKLFLLRVACTVGMSALFFALLFKETGYSIIHNFFVARGHNSEIVSSNFSSAFTYITYFLMNAVEFIFYLGIPLVYLFFKGLPTSLANRSRWFTSGIISLFFFLIIGIFQGEVGRIWLFIAPFFAQFCCTAFDGDDDQSFSAVLMLLFLQILTVQICFYTFW